MSHRGTLTPQDCPQVPPAERLQFSCMLRVLVDWALVRDGLAFEAAGRRLAWLGSPGSLAQNLLSSGETLGESVWHPSLPEPRPQVLPAVLAAAYLQCLRACRGLDLGH